MSSRRAGKKTAAQSAAERLRLARQNKDSLLEEDNEDGGDDDQIYEEVDELEYQQLSKRRLLEEDDFVIDDDGQGYADYGQDAFERQDDDDLDESDEEDVNDIDGKRKRKKKSKKDGSIRSMFSKSEKAKKGGKQAGVSADNVAALPKIQDEAADANLLDSIFDDMDKDADLQVKREQKRQKTINESFLKKEPSVATSSSSSTSHQLHQDMGMGGLEVQMDDGPQLIDNDYDDSNLNNNFDDGDDANSELVDVNAEPAPIVEVRETHHNISANVKVKALEGKKSAKLAQGFVPKFAPIAAEDSDPRSSCANWSSIKDSINVDRNFNMAGGDLGSSSASTMKENHFEEDGRLQMYWIDAYESNGVVYLFGKVFNMNLKKFVSCCVTVKNMQRRLLVLPRPFVVTDSGDKTDKQVEMNDVYEELDHVLSKHNIKEFACRPVERGYAFDDVPDAPAEGTYMKVAYSFSQPPLPSDINGKTFSNIFGANTNALELLILKRRLMGPCWITISNAEVSNVNISWCRVEVSIQNPKDFMVMSEDEAPPPPPLNVMSLSIKTCMHPTKRTNEIVAMSILFYHDVPLEGNGENLSAQQYTYLRQWNNIPIPSGFDEMKANCKSEVQMFQTELHMLNLFTALLHKLDPDVLVGHNFVGFTLDVLLHRMKSHKLEKSWSKIGRLRRTRWPKLQSGAGGMGESSAQERQVASGRLLCDTYLMAKDLVRSKNYSLTELAFNQLNFNRVDIDSEKVGNHFWKIEDLSLLVNICECDAYLCSLLMFKLQIIPLTLQLTKLAGNLWARTMTGARAERNEYLLLHEFHEKKFVVPDKSWGGDKSRFAGVGNEGGDDDDDVKQQPKKSARRKPAYAGGLVLEPKKGFYDKFVLLLDFNSLYPSIIQEYNICFTTVQRNIGQLEDQVPDPPDATVTQGILPRLLAALVNRRRQVKQLMKDPKLTESQKIQYDIRQKALKLTANSMYGCLGFSHSRFFAKQLAMLVTAKGREILQATVDMATEQGLDVIYGDTDSIMIYTHTDDVAQVRKIGNEFKASVNRRYKLLEIELDGMFQRMLLLKKKKYAALVLEEKVGGVQGGGKYVTKMEVKGLDEVRRDWCEASKESSNYVLTQLFSGKPREEAIENIHQFLTNTSKMIRLGSTRIEKFIIYKGLTKNPEEYADKNTQPHVQVALQLKARGLQVRVGDTIPYVICKPLEATSGEKGSELIANRAFHPDDVKKDGSMFKIDYEWYLSNQIHPPVARLCEPIEETDSGRIADCLGLDASKYQRINLGDGNGVSFDQQVHMLESQMSDEERFRDVTKWSPKCSICHHSSTFPGIVHSKTDDVLSGLKCQNPDCGRMMPIPSLFAQLGFAIRTQVTRFRDSWLLCDDPACRCRTRQMSIRARQCPGSGCRGFLSFEYGHKAFLTQLQYYASLFDATRLLKKVQHLHDDKTEQMRSIIQLTQEDIQPLFDLVEGYLNENASRSVDLEKLFSFIVHTN